MFSSNSGCPMRTRRATSSLRLAASSRSGSFTLPLGLALGIALAGCANVGTRTTDKDADAASTQQADAGKTVVPPYRGGGYYKDDGPGANPPENLDAIPDAVPKAEPFNRATSKAYKVLGKRYVPLADNADFKQRGLASWYGRKFHGNTTSIGEPYDMYAMTAAHATLPLPSYARVTNLENGKSVVVRINDRGPFHPGRIIDLSYTAAHKLDVLKGVTQVEVAALQPGAAPTSFEALAEADPAATSTEAMPEPARIEAVDLQVANAQPKQAVYLQLGAFSSPVAADDLMAKVAAKLSSNFPGVMRLEANGLYKVQAGPFSDVASADQVATMVRDDLGIKAFKVIANTPPPVVAEAERSPGLYLQLAALSSPTAAEALADRVKHRFGSELPGLNQINAGTLFKLQAGPFADPAAAERLAQAYLQDFGVKPYRVIR